MNRRDTIEAQRAGFVAGLRSTTGGKWTPAKQKFAEEQAAKAYPLTMVRPRTLVIERPRMIRNGRCGPWVKAGLERVEYTIVDGKLMVRTPFSRIESLREWRDAFRTRQELLELLELFNRPTEEVEL